jgi:uncharacterized repeat protein (TIGR03806 family)
MRFSQVNSVGKGSAARTLGALALLGIVGAFAAGCGESDVVDAETDDLLVARVPASYEWPESCIARVAAADGSDDPEWVNSISETGCFDLSTPGVPQAVEGALFYNVRSPLWSDGAEKERFLFLAPGTRIEFFGDRAWKFEDGTVLAKHFYLEDRLVETRLMVKEGPRWVGASYRWREDGSDADVVLDGATATIGGQEWSYPSTTDCDSCHTRASGFVLGLATEQMNRNSDMFGLGEVDQIRGLQQAGLFTEAPDSSTYAPPLAPLDDAAASLEYRARSYLAANCAGCHRPGGAAHTDVDLRMIVPLAETGLCEPSVASYGMPPGSLVVAAGSAEDSVLLHLLELEGSGQMPPLGVNSPDPEGRELLRNWIEQLETCE